MSLYIIQYDGDTQYVEAGSIREAVKIWARYMKEHTASEVDYEDEPESVACVHTGDVLRGTVTPQGRAR